MTTATPFRLVRPGNPGRGDEVQPGDSVELAPGIVLMLADRDGNVMIERRVPVAAGPEVLLDGVPVYEVVHARPLQEIRVGGVAHVILPPYGILIRPNGGIAARRPATDAGVTTALPTSLPATQKGSRRRLLLLGAAAVVAVLGAAAALLPPGAAQKGAVAAPIEAAEPAVAPVDVAPPVVVEKGPAPSGAPTGATEVTAATAVAPAATDEPAQPAPPPRAKPKRVKQPKVEAAPKAPADTSLPVARERQIHADIESYQLEAGFDPEGAAKKLRRLKTTVPAHARVQKDIDKALKAIGM